MIGLTVLANLVVAHVHFPHAKGWTRKFLALSYPDGNSYRQGQDDLYFVSSWFMIFLVLRAIVIDYILQPAAAALGVERKSQMRFAEQGWLALYYLVFWSMGMVR